ncbi:MAG: protein kinase domain-containing protein [Planctomycetales bacterium]
METPTLAPSFLELLERSGLVPAAEVEGALERLKLAATSNSKDLARGLVRDGVITRFQAERLLEGRYRGFFINQYKVLDILGAGGMACLYLVEDRKSRQKFALKVLSEKHQSDAGMLARLKLEARAGKKLKHSSIVRTYGIHRTDDVFGEVFYLVMEYVEGVNLEELINLQGPVPWAQAADFIREAAAGLQHAHNNGMVHRDVKPGNLLVDAQGQVKILDFGLALLDTAEEDEFSLAMIFGHSCLGTADYIAPEQAMNSSAVDPRADIYSLGCTLYVALTGRLPFPMPSSSDKIDGHRRLSPPAVASLVEGLPPALAAVVEKMMAKRPDDRFQSMAEVVQALTPLAQRMPVAFDFSRILAWRAKEARRRLGTRSIASSSTNASNWALRGLPSASTKFLPQAAVETRIAPPADSPDSVVSLAAPFAEDARSVSLSRSEIRRPLAKAREPALIPLGEGEHAPLVGDRLVIGRDPLCDVRLNFPSISGRHCELSFDGTLWRVVDLGSKNGVQVNGVDVTEQLLLPGDRLSIARQHHFRVEYTQFVPVSSGRLLPYVVAGALLATLALATLAVWRWW